MRHRIKIIALLLCGILVACSDDNNSTGADATGEGDVAMLDAGSDSGDSDTLNAHKDADPADISAPDVHDTSAVDASDIDDSTDADADANDTTHTDADVDDAIDAIADAITDVDDVIEIDTSPDTGVITDDWFDPQSCAEDAWSAADALARLGSSDSEILDSQSLMERSRTCDSSGCGPWSTPAVNSLSYLTWSGGVTTRYINLQSDTTLVLYQDDEGAPMLSIRHDTHLAHYPHDHDEGILFGFPSQIIPYPKMRAWKLPPSQHPYDYTDLENYLGRDAQLHVSAHCARFEAVSPARDSGSETVREYVAVYRF